VEARLEQGMTLFFNDDAPLPLRTIPSAHHSLYNVTMRAHLCLECGVAELLVIDPARAVLCADNERHIQEEDF
jgi:hypothetical protein